MGYSYFTANVSGLLMHLSKQMYVKPPNWGEYHGTTKYFNGVVKHPDTSNPKEYVKIPIDCSTKIEDFIYGNPEYTNVTKTTKLELENEGFLF